MAGRGDVGGMEGRGTAVVVGAGPAGLAAAWTLERAGWRVTIREERGGAGGRMRTDEVDGASADVAVQLLSSTYAQLIDMAKDLGAADRIVRAPGRDALWRKGRAHGITYGSVASMITSSALPTTLKLRLAARYLPYLAHEARGLDANDPSGSGGARLDTASIAEWGGEHLGADFVELLAYPLLAAYYGGPPESTSAAMYHALAKVGLDVEVLAVRGGMGALAGALLGALRARGVVFHGGDAVTGVSASDDGVTLSIEGDSERYDIAVVAVPARRARQILDPEGALAVWFDGVHTAPTTTLALTLERRPDADFFGISFPRTAPPGDTLVAVCLQSNKVPGLVPPGSEVLVAFPAPPLVPSLMEMETAAVVERLVPAVERVFPNIRSSIVRARVHRFTDGYALFRPGYLRHLRTYDPSWLPDRIALAGDYLVAPTVEGAVISGRRAATSLLSGSTRAGRG